MTMPALAFGCSLVVAMQTASEFSHTMDRHAVMTSHSAEDVVLVALGAIIVVATTVYTIVYLVRPGETAADHIKRRILDEGRLEPR